MEFHQFGDDSDPGVLFVLGWGNRITHPTVEWFVDRLEDAGFRVHAAEIPDNGTNFERDYLHPVVEYARGLDEYRVLSHSTGGLVAAHLPPVEPRVYLSPFWGMNREGWAGVLLPVLSRLPTSRQFVGQEFNPGILGELKDREAAEATPDASPAWLRAMRDAQASLPAFRDGSVVFCSLRDRVVGVRAIGEHAPADSVELYDGGHELFASRGRDGHADRVIDALHSIEPVRESANRTD